MPFELLDPISVDAYLDTLVGDDPELAWLLKMALSNPLTRREANTTRIDRLPAGAPDWAQRKHAAGTDIRCFRPDAALDRKVRHIADWIKSAILDDAEWLRRRDPNQNGKPNRFKKISTLEMATAEADKDMRLKNKALASVLESSPAGDGEREVAVLADGFRMVQLLTPAALDREGALMGHCIGQGAYDAIVMRGTWQFFSLRDRRNHPHATVEVAEMRQTVTQCQGKENKLLVARYRPLLAQWMQERGLYLDAPACECGMVQAQGGSIYSVDALPEGLKTGELDLCDMAVERLPKGLVVAGDCLLIGTQVTELPEGLEVGGDLFLEGSKVTQLPEGLVVRGQVHGLPKLASAVEARRQSNSTLER